MADSHITSASAPVQAPRVIASRVIDPREPSLFVKRKKSDPAEHLTITCQLDECPLLKAGFCAERNLFAGCPYGSSRDERGPTRRAANFGQWVRDHKAMHPGIGWNLSVPPKKLAFVGEYVYLPYSHMDMLESRAFEKGKLFERRTTFIKREKWTLELVLSLIDLRPQAIFGGEILSYQGESVPAFIAHIREIDTDMWRQLIAVRPELDTTPNYVGRKAILRTLAYPIEIPPKHSEYQVPWSWDGKVLRSTSRHAYSGAWGGIEPESLSIELVPAPMAAVIVASNAWVTPETMFVD